MLIDRRALMMGGSAAAFLSATPLRAAVSPGPPAWYRNGIIIDGLGGFGDTESAEDVTRFSDKGWNSLVATGVTIVRDTVFPVGNVADPWADYQASIGEKTALLKANPDRILLIRSAADILRAKREGKHGIVLGTQDTSMVGPSLDRLAQMTKDGVMSVQLTYNNGNLSGDGALEPRDGGLTKLGRKTIERIEAERQLLDLSHGGARTMAEAAAVAKRPLVISHTASRALTDHPRNTSDATMRAVADKGGVVGVYWMPFLTLDSHPKGSDLLDHIDHVARVVGEDHVGIGTDNGPLPQLVNEETTKRLNEWAQRRIDAGIAAPGEGLNVWPMVADYNTIDRYWRLANDLAKRGWSQSRLEKLMGGNFLRVYRDAWGG